MCAALSISFIIVNYNSAELAERCVASIREAMDEPQRDEIVVVDNASPGVDAERLATAFESLGNVRFIPNSENVGFGAACNQAIEGARGDLIWLVNPDAALKRDVIDGVVAAFQDENAVKERIGAISPSLLDGDGRSQRVGQDDPSPRNYWRHYSLFSDFRRASSDATNDPDKTVILRSGRLLLVDWLMGATLCLRREALESLDGAAFDSRYFLYFEDADLCRRLREKGWASGLLDGPPALHETQQSSGSSPAAKRFTLVHFFRSALNYAERWMSPGDQAAFRRRIRLDMRLRLLLLPLRRSIPADEKSARRDAYREIIALTKG